MGDVNIEGITINLVDADGNIVMTATTDASGNYEFEDVVPGDYTVVEATEPGDDYQDISDFDESVDANDPDGDDGATPNDEIPVTVVSGESDADNDFVEEQLGSIWGNVSADTNNDGAGEEPLEGITITLLDAAGNVVETTTTDEDSK